MEIWSGGSLTVDATGVHNGEINVDTSMSGGVQCCAWVDLFARDDIRILGAPSGAFAVHGNQTVTNAFGAHIQVKSTEGSVVARGRAIEASATRPGGTGGQVAIEAAGLVDLNEAIIVAAGDNTAGGGFGVGGQVAVRFAAAVDWRNLAGGTAATGDVRPTGSIVPAADIGTIALTACTAVTTTGTSFPISGRRADRAHHDDR